MWVRTNSKHIVNLDKAYFIGIESTSHDKFWVFAAMPFYMADAGMEERIYLTSFATKEECEGCIQGIFDKLSGNRF